jgi:hypothetical protein
MLPLASGLEWTHYLPLGPEGEKGVDVWLALEAYELAIYKRFDVSVLVVCDGAFLPLVRKLNTLGTRVMLLGWDFRWTDRDPGRGRRGRLPMDDLRRTVESFFRQESGRIIASLIRVSGSFDSAEEAMQDAFASALARWPAKGIPDNPPAKPNSYRLRSRTDRCGTVSGSVKA